MLACGSPHLGKDLDPLQGLVGLASAAEAIEPCQGVFRMAPAEQLVGVLQGGAIRQPFHVWSGRNRATQFGAHGLDQ